MDKKVKFISIFYGPLSSRVGGGEVGNQRTIGLLNALGIQVIGVSKPYPKKNLLSPVQYIVETLAKISLLLLLIIKNKVMDRKVTLHISGFYFHLIYFELLIIIIGKLLKTNVVYEMRAGGVKRSFDEGSIIYKLCFKLAVKNSSHVLVQGQRYLDFIKTNFNSRCSHYPNFVENLESKCPKFIPVSNVQELNFVFFGRVCRAKGVDIAIDTISILCKKHSKNCTLTLIGDVSEAFQREMITHARNLGIEERVLWLPASSRDELFRKVSVCDFFIFPSMEPREGQSNSLTEAVSLGLIPLASNAGFNLELIGNSDLISFNNTADEYADMAINIVQSDTQDSLYKAILDNISKNYNRKNAMAALRKAYVS